MLASTKPPAGARRFGAKDSATRAALVQAGIEVLQDQGANAFTAKSVAEQAGLKPQLVHYYFRTMEDLVLAIVDLAGSEGLRRAARAAASKEPLRELWQVSMNERSSALVPEVKALAQNSEAVRHAIVRQGEQHRTLMAEVIGRHLEVRGRKLSTPPMSIVMVLEAISRLVISDRAVGFSLGHEEMLGSIEEWLEAFYADED
jgi:AcrR family transcriptional regulator